MNFASDNWAGAHSRIVEAVAAEAGRFGAAYGAAETDRRAAARFSEIFETAVSVFPVATGTAANALSMAAVARPGGFVFCHRESHSVEDECGAVEHLTGGARLYKLDGPVGKIAAADVATAVAAFDPAFVHGGRPMAVSITQATEAGGVYTVTEIEAIAAAAHAAGLPLHMDGARFANALVAIDAAPAEMTWRAGVDILSFGGTKNGCIGADAIVVFDASRALDLPWLRMRTAHNFSKARFVSAQFEAYFADGLWLRMAGHARVMADLLRAGLDASPHARQAWPTESNEVFAVLRRTEIASLREKGASLYDWHTPHGADLGLTPDEGLVRLVTSFATERSEVDAFLAHVAK
jgi:threonine aldolase